MQVKLCFSPLPIHENKLTYIPVTGCGIRMTSSNMPLPAYTSTERIDQGRDHLDFSCIDLAHFDTLFIFNDDPISYFYHVFCREIFGNF